MVTFPTPHPVEWVAPAPLWPAAIQNGAPDETAAMRAPALLTIPADNFMDVLTQQLASNPPGISVLRAQPKSFRVRPPGRPADWEPDPAAVPFKLYQAAHGHFNLVAASLVCQIPGLPEHGVHPELKEQVAFVIRRWDGATEYAWVGTSATGTSWQAVPAATAPPGAGPSATAVEADEQLLPMFPVNYTLDDGGARKLFVGLVPTSSVETYNQGSSTAGQAGGIATRPGVNGLMTMSFDTRITRPLTQFTALTTEPPSPPLPNPAPSGAGGSPMLVLEFASFLNDWFPISWPAVAAGDTPPVNSLLYAWLSSHNADQNAGLTWLRALRSAWAQSDFISGEAVSPPAGEAVLALNVAYMDGKPTDISDQIGLATPETAGTTVPGSALAAAPKLDPRQAPYYVLRCVYRRPECLLGGDVVGDRSEPFQIATFFDFDAPARSVTVSLPRVSRLSDLRKFRKNVNFLISQELHNQIDQIIDLPNAIKGQFNAPSSGGGFQLGWICSFSIPIITICALFVLIMFVILLNLVFWWLPFFEICLPVPE